MKNILFILFCEISFCAHAQNIEYLSGGVYDSRTKEALIGASVYYKDFPIGTIANTKGEFIIDKLTDSDTIVFSYLGYVAMKYNINNMPVKIYLEPLEITLPELIVTPGYANKLVKKIWEKYNNLYKSEEKKQKEYSFFYRQITKTDTLYNEFIESFFTGKNGCGVSDLKIQEGRYANYVSDSLVTFSITNFFQNAQIRPFHQKNPPKKIINTFLQPNFEKIYDITIEDRIMSKENSDILIFRFRPKTKAEEKYIISGKLYVRENDLSIIRFEGTASDIGLDNPQIKHTNFIFRVNYKDNPDTDYPIVETVDYKVNLDLWVDNILHKIEVNSVLFQENLLFQSAGKKIKQDDNLIKMINKKGYNPEFWNTHPIIKRTEIEEEAIRFFENHNVFGTFNVK